MMSLLRLALRHAAFRHGRLVGLYRRFCQPDGIEWAEFLRRRGTLRAMGRHCSIQTNTVITDPAYVRLGDNVRLSGCTLFGHDGSVNMINRAYGVTLDRVGKIDIADNVFVGHGAVILPGVTIGSRVIVATGAVVTRDVPDNVLVAGVPARVVCPLDDYVERLRAETGRLPWADLLARRTEANYWELQPRIEELRLAHFFGGPAA